MAPPKKKVVVLIDGQNLYHLAMEAWGDGYHWPKYDPAKLARELVALEPDRELSQVRFYTGVPSVTQNRKWHAFWTAKTRAMEAAGVVVFKGRIMKGREKGVDVRIALDLVRLTRERAYDTVILVCQDSDLNEALAEALRIVKEQHRWVTFESAHPIHPDPSQTGQGLRPAKFRGIDRAMYDRCTDHRDYRPKPRRTPAAPAAPATLEGLKDKYNKSK
jgi:uncharacterized LabA/DUF88 family protein